MASRSTTYPYGRNSTAHLRRLKSAVCAWVHCRPKNLRKAAFCSMLVTNSDAESRPLHPCLSEIAFRSGRTSRLRSREQYRLSSTAASLDASVIVPLYVYPSAGAWDLVYEMASLYAHVQFTAIVNPHSGSGEGALPSESYTQAIQVVNALDNVRAIGYVATTWCTQNMSSVLDEIFV